MNASTLVLFDGISLEEKVVVNADVVPFRPLDRYYFSGKIISAVYLPENQSAQIRVKYEKRVLILDEVSNEQFAKIPQAEHVSVYGKKYPTKVEAAFPHCALWVPGEKRPNGARAWNRLLVE